MRVCSPLAVVVLSASVAFAAAPPPDLRANATAALASLSGEVRLPGLKGRVEVLRDRWGIPHLYAGNADDLFFAQGFVAAQDRLFQIDWWRRLGAGEMAEAFGAGYLEADRFARLVRYRGDRDAEWASYSPDARRIAEAFARGVNAYIDHIGDRLPVEFQAIGYAPKKWRAEDVLGRMSGIYMSGNFTREIARARLVHAVGLDKARWLAPVDPARAYAPAEGLDLAGIDDRILAGYNAATRAVRLEPAATESNNWVVSGARSASGKPLLANDPHRAIALPSLRYLVHLNAPGWNVIGSGEPGLPGVAVGHNERIAWGFTIVGTDQGDLYVETTKPGSPNQYRVGDRWEEMKVIREEVRVRDRPHPVPLELRFTRHGPVLFQDARTNRAFALKWAGSEPGGAAYLASLAVDRATNRKEFLAALGRWKIPSLNFVYADVDGNIGWVASGLTPIRRNHDGLLPVPGLEKYDWQGYLSTEQLAQTFNPESGFIATANHNILPAGYKHEIGYEFAAPYRHQRLRDALSGKERRTLDDMKALQHDNVTLPGRTLARLAAKAEPGDDAGKRCARLLADWDGRLSVESPAGPIYAAWMKELKEAMLSLHLPKEMLKPAGTIVGVPVWLKALETADPRWFGRDAVAARDKLLRDTFARAVKHAHALPERWGALHTVTFRHPLSPRGPAWRAFDLGPVERPGDEYCPNNTRHDDTFQQVHGATYRHLLDLADWDRGLATSAPGQSGQPGSPHYGDLLPLWARGEYFPLAYSRKMVESVTRHRLILLPAR